MKELIYYLRILEKEIAYQERVYKAKTKRYQELVNKRNIIEFMIFLSMNS